MKFDFETMPDRRGKDSIAADMNENDFWPIPRGITKPGFDKIPMWIADMNFLTAPAVTEALIERIGHPVYGYFVPGDEYYDAIIRWQKQSHGVECLAQSDIGYENGVLGGVTSALRVLCSDGEPVLVHSPTYSGFTTQLERNGFRIVLSPLKQDEGGICRMDFADMESKIKKFQIHTALFCSPHNPSGRVWEQWELEKMIELFEANDVFVISDEIWSDLALFGNRHIPLQSVSDAARERTVAFYSPSKTFNLAGLVGSYHIIYNRYLRERIRQYESLSHYNEMNVLSMRALVGAYRTQGRLWMEELKRVLERNILYACDFIQTNFEGISFFRPQGTYILLLDCMEWCRKHGKTAEELQEAGIAVGVVWREGSAFHVPYGIRMNLALPYGKLAEAFERLKKYVFTAK